MNSMNRTDEHPIRLDVETFLNLEPIVVGENTKANVALSGEMGIAFEFDSEVVICSFNRVSSAVMFHELYSTEEHYPYLRAMEDGLGLYECVGSSYLERVAGDKWFSGGSFMHHKHYIYADNFYFWHIVAEDLNIERRNTETSLD